MSKKAQVVVPLPAAGRDLRLHDYLPYRLSVAANAVSGVIARAYEDRFALTIPQWRLVAVLAEQGPLTPQAICGRTVMDKVTVGRAAQGLLKRKLVRRAPNPTDKRSHLLSLTPSGEKLYSEIAPLALSYAAAVLKDMNSGEIRQLTQLLLRVQRSAEALSRQGLSSPEDDA